MQRFNEVVKWNITWGDAHELLKHLGGGVGDDGEGRDQVEQQHNLHSHTLPPVLDRDR